MEVIFIGFYFNYIAFTYYTCNVPNLMIIEGRVRWALNFVEHFKSPLQDGIMPVVLQNTEKVITSWLMANFRGCLRLTNIPDTWKQAIFDILIALIYFTETIKFLTHPHKTSNRAEMTLCLRKRTRFET